MRESKSSRIPRILLCTGLALALSGAGCASHDLRTAAAIEQFRAGQVDAAIGAFERNRAARDRQLMQVESARLNLLDGRFDASRAAFGAVLDEWVAAEEGAVVRLRDAGGAALAATLADDRSRPYTLAGYELVMALQQQALNHLFLGDSAAAQVEARRAVFVQDRIAEQRAAEEEAARQKLSEGMNAQAYETWQQRMAAGAPVLARVKSAYQNAYAWYVCALLYEAGGDRANAYVALKKTWELAPENPHLLRDLVRLARTENPDEEPGFRAAASAAGVDLVAAEAELVVVLEEGWISRRRSVKLPIPVGRTWQAVTFPVYDDGAYEAQPMSVAVASFERGLAAPLCYPQSLAYRDLSDRMPGIVVRNVTRAATRAAVQKQLLDSKDAGTQLVGLLANVGTLVADEADTRAWYSLPMAVQIFRVGVPAGSHVLRLCSVRTGAIQEVPLVVESGEWKLVWAADLVGRTVHAVVPLRGGGAEFHHRAGLLDEPVFASAVVAPPSEPEPIPAASGPVADVPPAAPVSTPAPADDETAEARPAEARPAEARPVEARPVEAADGGGAEEGAVLHEGDVRPVRRLSVF